jgi:hypothetical protein
MKIQLFSIKNPVVQMPEFNVLNVQKIQEFQPGRGEVSQSKAFFRFSI